MGFMDDQITPPDDLQPILNASASLGVGRNPDRVAGMIETAKKLNIPTSFIEHDEGEEARRQAVLNEFSAMTDKSPAAAKWIAKSSDNAALTQDDLPTLSQLEQKIKAMGDAKRNRSTLGIASTQDQQAVKDMPNKLAKTWNDVIVPTPARAWSGFVQGSGGVEQWIGETFGIDSLAARGKAMQQAGKEVDAYMAAEYKLAPGSWEEAGASALQSMYLQAPFMAAGMLANTVRGAIATSLSLMGLTTAGQTYGERRDAGHGKLASSLSALWDGTVEVGTELLPTKELFGMMKPAAKQSFGKLLYSATKLYGKEMVGEFFATLLQDANAKVMQTPGMTTQQKVDAIGDYFSSGEATRNAIATFKSTFIQTSLMAGAGAGVNRIRSRGMMSAPVEHNQAMMDFVTNAEESKLKQRAPDSFAEFVQTAADQHDIGTVYLQSDKLVEAARNASMSVEDLAVWADQYGVSASDLNTAVASEGAIELETGKVAAGVKNDALLQALQSDLTIDPDVHPLSKAETALQAEHEHLVRLEELFQQDQAQKINNEDIDAWSEALLSNPALKGKVTEEHLMPLIARANALQTFTGVPAIEHLNAMLGQAGLQVMKYKDFQKQKYEAAGFDKNIIDAIRKGNIPTDEQAYGPSLIEFLRSKGGVQDHKGELAAMDAQLATRKAFKKNFVSDSGMPLDTAKELAVESGYLGGDATITDLLDAISGELSGNMVFSADNRNEAVANHLENIRQTQESMNQAGIDAADDIDTITAKLNELAYNDLPFQRNGVSLIQEVNGNARSGNPASSTGILERSKAGAYESAQAIASRVYLASEENARPSDVRAKEADQLRQFAEANNLILDVAPMDALINEQGISGTDNYVYFHNNTHAIKINKFKHAGTFTDLFSNIDLHNRLFPDITYLFEGFVEYQGELSPVFSQEFVENELTDDPKRLEQLAADTLISWGFTRIDGEFPFISTAKFVKGDIVVRDINPKNVAYVNGKVIFFDPVVEIDQAKRTKENMMTLFQSDPISYLTLDREGVEYNHKIVASENGVSYVVRNQEKQNDSAENQPAKVMERDMDALAQIQGQLSLFAPETQKPPALNPDGYVKKVVVGSMYSAITKVTTPTEAAHIAYPLAIKAQEAMIGIVTNKGGKVLGVVQHTTGTINQSLAHPRDFLGVVNNIDGAANVWLAHNHPSGDPTLSKEDKEVARRFEMLSEGSGVSVRGILAVGMDGGAVWWSDGSGETFVSQESIDLLGPRSKKIKTIDRELTGRPDAPQIRDPGTASAFVNDEFPGKTGLLILNTKNIPSAFVEMSFGEMSKLKTGKTTSGSSAIMQSFHKGNGAAMIVVGSGIMGQRSAVQNIVSFGDILGGRVLDALDPSSGESMTTKGILPGANGAFYQGDSRPLAALSQADGQNIITLFERSDKSSFLHETGHIFLNDLKRVAEQYGVQTEQWQQVKEWLGIGDDGAITREQHEKFAEHFEVYLKDGVAPSLFLRDAFRSFKSWLTRIYDMIKSRRFGQRDLQIKPEIRDLFDSLLATEQEIQQVREQSALIAMLDNELLNNTGYTQEQIDEYRKIANQAEQSANEKRDKHKLVGRDERIKGWQEQAERESIAVPLYGFIEAIKGLKVQKPDWATKSLPIWDKDGMVLDHVVAENGELFGYNTAAEFISDLNSKPTREQWIKKRVAQLETEYNNQQETADAVRTASLRKLLELESEWLAQQAEKQAQQDAAKTSEQEQRWNDAERKLVDQMDKAKAREEFKRQTKPTPQSVIRKWADGVVANRTMKKIGNLAALLSESRKHRQQAIALTKQGDFIGAFKSNEQARLTEGLIAASYRAKAEFSKMQNVWNRAIKSKSVDWDYHQQVLQLMVQFGIKNNLDVRPGTPSFTEFMAALAANVEDEIDALGLPMVPEVMTQQTSIKDMTFAELGDFTDMIRFLDGRGREIKDALMADGKTRIADAVTVALEDASRVKRNMLDSLKREGTLLRKGQEFIRGYLARNQILLFLVRQMDGESNIGKNGVAGRNESLIWRPLMDGTNKKLQLQHDINQMLKPHIEHLLKRAKETFDFELPDSFKRYNKVWDWEKVVAVALNRGNASNLQRLMDGYRYDGIPMTDAQLQDMLNVLTNEDWNAIQGIWDAIDSMYPEMNRVHKRINHFPMKKIEATPFVVNGQEYAGGYYPVKYDADLDDKIARWTEKDDLLNRVDSMRQAPVAKSGMTKDRQVTVQRPVKLSLSVMAEHVEDTTNYIAMAEAVRDADRITKTDAYAERAKEVLGLEGQRMIRAHLKGIIRPEQPMHGGWERFFEKSRALMSTYAMAYNTWTALQNTVGLFPLLHDVGWGNYFNGVSTVMANPVEAYRSMTEMSVYMKNRMDSLDRDIRKKTKQFKPEFNVKGMTVQDVRDAGFWGIKAVDMANALPCWWGAYNDAVAKGMSQSEAVKFADTKIQSSQGSGLAIDLSDHQRAQGYMRFFTNFMTFAITQQNILAQHWRAMREGNLTKAEYAYGTMMVLILPQLVTTILKSAIQKGEPPETEEVAGDMLSFLFSGFPLLRDLVQGARAGLTKDFNSSTIRMASMDILNTGGQAIYHTSVAARKLITGEDAHKATRQIAWDAAVLGSMVTGVPASTLYKKWEKGMKQIDQGNGHWWNLLIPDPKTRMTVDELFD